MGRQLLSLGPARPPRGRLLGPPRAIGIAWPFQATSREMVETALPSRAAIWRSESPAINPRESSLRSAKDNRRGDRARDRGIMPPVRAMNRWIDLVEHPTAAAALAKVSPSETRRWISTWSSWLSRLPWSARRRCISPPPEPVARIIAEMLRRSHETASGFIDRLARLPDSWSVVQIGRTDRLTSIMAV